MIDTDKYEGHTIGDMTFSQAGEKLWFLEHPHSHNASDCMTMNKATLDLIADAPLLLEEVRRLRELLYKCWKDSGQSLYYIQVELLKNREYWYEQMICDDDSKKCYDYDIGCDCFDGDEEE